MDRFAAGHGGVAPGGGRGRSQRHRRRPTRCAWTAASPRRTPSWPWTCRAGSRHAGRGSGPAALGRGRLLLRRHLRHAAGDPASGRLQPALAFPASGSRPSPRSAQKTIEAAFGGDTAAFDRLTPLAIMAEQQLPAQAVYFGAGDRDPEFVGYMDELSAAARQRRVHGREPDRMRQRRPLLGRPRAEGLPAAWTSWPGAGAGMR